MAGPRVGCRWAGVLAVAVGCLTGPGCVHSHAGGQGPNDAPIAVPPPGTVPAELVKITLPPYVIEPPDILLIEVRSRGVKLPDEEPKKDEKGVVIPATPKGKDSIAGLPVQEVSGSFPVRPDGSVGIGYWGSVPVAGLTLEQAAQAIRQHLVQSEDLQKLGVKPESLLVIVDVLAYNSKKYYVITDGGGFGERVFPFPVYGSETVLDALANINGLPEEASKRNIWVARRTPHPGQPWQILPVDWVGITQHGITQTNYQIMPGDRIYVKAQRLVTIDRTLARIISPVERVFGVTLLGASTVNQIKNRGNNGSGGN